MSEENLPTDYWFIS